MPRPSRRAFDSCTCRTATAPDPVTEMPNALAPFVIVIVKPSTTTLGPVGVRT